jgi:hypothetical protein
LAGSGSGTGFGGGEEARFGSRVKYALEVVELFGLRGPGMTGGHRWLGRLLAGAAGAGGARAGTGGRRQAIPVLVPG